MPQSATKYIGTFFGCGMGKWVYKGISGEILAHSLILLLVKSNTVRVLNDSRPQVSRKLRIPASPTAQCSKDISVRWWHPLSRLWARNRN